ncbi:MAG TPA: type VI secretion system protein TssA [Marinagarivorans sp.]
MPLDYIINLDQLLAPISDEQPHGTDIREDRSPTSSFYRIKDARNEGRSAERAAILDPNVDTVSPWQTVLSEAETILSTQSKDIEVTCWFIEGMIRLYGFAGFRDGVVLLDKLVDQYWDNLYPEPDEDGIETKVIPITGLNGESGEGTLLTPMRNALMCDPYSDSPFTFWEYQQAHAADNIPEAKAKASRIDELGYSLSSIQNAIMRGDGQYFTQLLATLEEAQAAFKHLSDSLRSHCGHDTPPSSNISNLLDEIIRTAKFIFKDKLVVSQAPAEEVTTDAAPSDALQTAPVQNGQVVSTVTVREGAIVDREDALKRLADVAEYFRRYEPHTPIGPGIERIIKWGRMTVSELMLELLPDDQAKGIYSQLTGVMLDGSDTQGYVAPPPAPKAKAEPAPAPAAKPEGAAEPAKAEKSTGW